MRRRSSSARWQPDVETATAAHPALPLLERVWQLPESLTAYDATYVALAETLGCDLLSADGRLARAPGLQCAVTVVPG
jgi:predicted nucleic acid-binding protein